MITGLLGVFLFVSSLVWAIYFDHLRNNVKYKGKSTFSLLIIGMFGFVVLFLVGGILAVNWLHQVLLDGYKHSK